MVTMKISRCQSILFSIIAIIIFTSCVKTPSYGLVFTANDENNGATGVYRFNSNDNSLVRLAYVNDHWFSIWLDDVSKDGKLILANYYSNETKTLDRFDRDSALFRVEQGKPLQQIFRLPQGISEAKLSPDRNHIAIIDSKYPYSLWIGDPNNLKKENLKQVSSSLWSSAGISGIDWSPDGKYLAYTKHGEISENFDKDKMYTEIFLVDISNFETKKLTDVSSGCIGPLWAPTGKWISMLCSGTAPLYRKTFWVAPDGSNMRMVEKNEIERETAYSYVWSPNGEYLAYLSFNLDKNIDIVRIVRTDESEVGEFSIPISDVYEIESFVWTPDNAHLIFNVSNFPYPDTDPEKIQYQLIQTDLKGNNLKILNDQFSNYEDLHIYKLP